jgi:hypothetical protein
VPVKKLKGRFFAAMPPHAGQGVEIQESVAVCRAGGCGNHNRIRKTAHADRLVSYQFSASCCDIITQFGSYLYPQSCVVVILFEISLQVGCFSTFLIMHTTDGRFPPEAVTSSD